MFDNIFNHKDMIVLQSLLKKHNKTITTAESCTGGLVASLITEISGSSEIFNGAIITYSNKIKNQELNVKNEILEEFGAVSIEVVNEMLNGVIKKFEANYAIAISGIAGPNGGTNMKPVGTVVIGISDNIDNFIEIFHFKGSRKEVQIQAAKTALQKFLNILQKTLDK